MRNAYIGAIWTALWCVVSCSTAMSQSFTVSASGIPSPPALVHSGQVSGGVTSGYDQDVGGSTITLKAIYTGASFDPSWPSDQTAGPIEPTGLQLQSFTSSNGVNLTSSGSASLYDLSYTYAHAGVTVSGSQQYYDFYFVGGSPDATYGSFLISVDPTLASFTYDRTGLSTITIANAPSGAGNLYVASTEYDGSSTHCGIYPSIPSESGTEFCGNASGTASTPIALNKLSIQRAPVTCGDVRDTIVAEYQSTTYDSILNVPLCTDFTDNPSGLFYDFLEYNQGDYNWALVRYPLTVPPSAGFGLNLLEMFILMNTGPGGGVVHNLTSGYRNPLHNYNIRPRGAPNSRHMFGDAVDMQNLSRSDAEHNNIMALATMAGAWTEPLSGPCMKGCIHVDWGTHPHHVASPGLYVPNPSN